MNWSATRVSAGLLLCLLAPIARGEIKGSWSIGGNENTPAGSVHLSLERNEERKHTHHSSNVPLRELRGLTAGQLDPGGNIVRFQLQREAGTFDCEGYLKDKVGGGAFRFQPSLNFPAAMAALQVPVTGGEEQVFQMAILNLTTDFVKELRAAGMNPDKSSDWFALRVHNVTGEYVRQLRGLFKSELKPGSVVGMKIHGVTPEFAQELARIGFAGLSADKLMALRIHKVDLPFINSVRAAGYPQVTLDQLLSMRIHRVDQKFMQTLADRGMKNLTIDQMLNLKIHGLVKSND